MYEFFIQTNIPIFHHSIIPSGLHETCSIKDIVISISCRISETFNYNVSFVRQETTDIIGLEKRGVHNDGGKRYPYRHKFGAGEAIQSL